MEICYFPLPFFTIFSASFAGTNVICTILQKNVLVAYNSQMNVNISVTREFIQRIVCGTTFVANESEAHHQASVFVWSLQLATETDAKMRLTVTFFYTDSDITRQSVQHSAFRVHYFCGAYNTGRNIA